MVKELFNVSVIKVINNEETLISTEQYKYKNTVKITASDIEGLRFYQLGQRNRKW